MYGLLQNLKLKPVLIFSVETTHAIYLSYGSTRLNPHTHHILHPCILTIIPNSLQAYDKWIQTELGEAIRAAKMATGVLLPSLYPVAFLM
jgi:hypothetical protein